MSGKVGAEYVRLTGVPRAQSGSREFVFLPDKRFQLLAYLAYGGDWVGRERVAFLFWPDTDTSGSRQNLRGLLQRLGSIEFDPDLVTTRHQLRWNVPTDVDLFTAAVQRGALDEALAAYQGPLMDGLASEDDGEFSEWLEIERERLRSDWRGVAIQRLLSVSIGEEQTAANLVRRVLATDPLDEEVVRAYLLAMARIGKVAEGRAVFQEFAAHLRSELGLEPTSSTVAALEALEDQKVGSHAGTAGVGEAEANAPAGIAPVESAATAASTAVASAAPVRGGFTTLPVLATTFVGRETELALIEDLLNAPTCRLLSLIGPGGVGKTRLAIAAAEHMATSFPDGVAFVPLDAVSSVELVAPALAAALGLTIPQSADPIAAIGRALVDRAVLVVMDNFEHLLEGATVVAQLLDAAPGVKVIVTSRERLNLVAEWLYPVEGLAYPATLSTVKVADEYGALALFLERARRVRPAFKVTDQDSATLVRLGELTAGLPLAIELAASWARALPLASIVDEIAGSFDALATDAPDGVLRHRSIRATFEQSWNILTEQERSAMRRLAVFRAAVSPEAAQFVAGASRALLTSLVDKSLLRLTEDGRFDRHPLLLAYSGEKLDEFPAELETVGRRHTAYYVRFLRERTDQTKGPRPARALASIDRELPEILAAAERSRGRGKSKQLIALMKLLALDTRYLPTRGYTDETIVLLEAAANASVEVGWLDAAHDLRGRLGDAFGNHRGDSHRGAKEYAAAAALAKISGSRDREAVLLGMCGVMLARTDPEAGVARLDMALAAAREVGDDLSLSTVLEQRAYVAGRSGDAQAANALYRESLELAERLQRDEAAEPFELDKRRFFALLNIGQTDQELGRFKEALQNREDALRIAEASDNPIWAAHAHLELGGMYGSVEQDGLAKEHLWKALELYRDNNVTAHVDKVVAQLRSHGIAVT